MRAPSSRNPTAEKTPRTIDMAHALDLLTAAVGQRGEHFVPRAMPDQRCRYARCAGTQCIVGHALRLRR